MGRKNLTRRASAFVLSLLVAFPPLTIAQTEDPLSPLVLMPVNGENLSDSQLSAYREAIADGLTDKYKIISDSVVDDTIREVSTEGIACDTVECLKDVVLEIGNVEHVATTTVSTEPGRFLILFKVTNVFETDIYSRSEICEDCSQDQVIELLKAMASGKKRPVFKKPGGTVTVTSEPFLEDALVYIDGKNKGNLPVTLVLPAGEHEVEVKSGDGKKLGKQTLTVSSGESVTVTVAIKPGPQKVIVAKKKPKKSNLWKWVLGAAVIGGAAALSGSDKGGDSGNGGETVNFEW